MSSNKLILFFEPDIDGHQLDYIEHLCNYYIKNQLSVNIMFVVNQLFFEIIKNRNKTDIFNEYKNQEIKFVEINQSEQRSLTTSGLIKSAFYKWKIANKYAVFYEVNNLHFLFLDHLQLPLALKFNYFSKFRVSGILFRLTLNYTSKQNTIISRIKRHVKYTLYKGMLNNNKVSVLFSLDPFFKEYAINEFNNGFKVKSLPDPSLFSDAFDRYSENIIQYPKKNKKLFLMFGHIERRKGILKLFDALEYLKEPILGSVIFCIAGKIDPDIKSELLRKQKKLLIMKKALSLHIIDKYIPEEELVSLLVSSDCVLAPYQEFSGSSSVILWSAGARKPVVTQTYGLIGKWVEMYKLGFSLDTSNPKLLADTIVKVADSSKIFFNRAKMDSFAKANTPNKFSEIIFSHIINKR